MNEYVCNELHGVQRIHLIGIGGAGMSSLALLLAGMNFDVSGCDLKASPYIPALEASGVKCEIGHAASHVERFAPQLVVYSSAVPANHVELAAARASNIRTAGRGQVLSWLFNVRFGIGVAGTHGKSTTSSMIGLILERAGLKPSLSIGAEVRDLGTNAQVGKSDLFVAEIDESDGSFEYFRPAVTVITNVDWDHVNFFHTKQDVIDAFVRFAQDRKVDAPLVICAEDDGSQKLLETLKGDHRAIVTCGWGTGWTWGAIDVIHREGGGLTFSLVHDSQTVGKIELGVSGNHNVMNALLACAVAHELDISFESLAETLQCFKGAQRRLEKKGRHGNIEVVDDYGHHPTEIAASIAAMRDMYPHKRLVVVYQPHRYTRTAAFFTQIASALSGADVVLLLPVYSAGEEVIREASSDVICQLIQKSSTTCFLCSDADGALSKLRAVLRDGDVLLTMGAGSVYQIGEAYLS